MVHDFEHGGLTNDFLVNSLDRLAVRYNDRSPLENHHLAAAFNLLQQPDFHFLSALPKGEFERFRKVGVWSATPAARVTQLWVVPCAGVPSQGRRDAGSIVQTAATRSTHTCTLLCTGLHSHALPQVVIELVLATDMKQHFSILSHFTTVHRLNAGGAMTPGTSTSDPMAAMRANNRWVSSLVGCCYCSAATSRWPAWECVTGQPRGCGRLKALGT